MVKIVGKVEAVTKHVTCRSCGSILEYTLSEVKSYHGKDYGGGPDGMDWVDCPNCGHKATIRSW